MLILIVVYDVGGTTHGTYVPGSLSRRRARKAKACTQDRSLLNHSEPDGSDLNDYPGCVDSSRLRSVWWER